MIYAAIKKSRSSRLSIRGADYQIIEWGDPEQPLLVYLHGWGDCAASFQFVVDELAGEWHVVAPDWRGFGGSRVAAAAYWFPDYLADLDVLLQHYSPDEPVRLLGHSMGANIAGLYAGTMPERVAAFVNIEGFGLRDTAPDEAPARYRRWLEMSRARPDFASYEDFTTLAQRIKRRSPSIDNAKAEFIARCWAEKRDGRVVLHADPAHKLPNAVLYRRAEAEACWRQVTAPVLLLAGGNSVFAEQETTGSAVQDLPFASAVLETIPDAGHMLHFEAAAALAARIEAFFNKHL